MRKSLREWLDTAASCVTVAAGILFIWMMLRPAPSLKPSIKLPSKPVSLAGAATRGNAAAPIVAVQFSDFECPFSARASKQVLPALLREYVDSGKVQWVFRNLPLPQHKFALGAAVAAECAAQQGRFWEMHDALFADPKKLSPEQLAKTATIIGLDPERFRTCLGNGSAERVVTDDLLAARQMGLASTPTLLMGVRTTDGQVRFVSSLEGSVSVDAFRMALDKAIAGDSGSRLLVYTALSGAVVLIVAPAIWYRRRRASALVAASPDD